MQIRSAETAGFCFGVERAVSLAEQTAKSCASAVTLGPIIHNRHVVERFEAMGLREIARAEDAQPGQTVVIRAHGIPVSEQQTLAARGAKLVDATCPFVKKIHVIARQAEEAGRHLLIIGTPTHPEVTAIASYSSDAHVFQTAEALESWLTEAPGRRDLPFCMVSQTTGTQKLWESCREIAKKVCTNCEIFDTICRATEMRQEEAAFLSKSCDAMVVVGDARSSNTGRLAMICSENCPKVAVMALSGDKFSGCASVAAGLGADGKHYLVLDGWTGISGNNLASVLLRFDDESQQMVPASQISSEELYNASLRNVPSLVSRDLDGDGTVEIPTQPDEAGLLNMSQSRRMDFIVWMDYTAAAPEKSFGLLDEETGCYIALPIEWEGNLMLTDSTEVEGAVELRTVDENKLVLTVRLASNSADAAGWTRLGMVASRQMQAKFGPDVTIADETYRLSRSLYRLN